MKAVRALAVALLVLLASSSCGEPTKPQSPALPTPDASLIGSLLGPTGLLKCSDLPYASSTQTIGIAGGSISAGPHTLVIPPGALAQPTTITMTAPTGLGVNAVTFQPAGLRFQIPAALTMSYANCSLLGLLLPKHIAYTTDNLDILYYLLGVTNVLNSTITSKINHFSDYVVAW
jgi:hypothetical protein